MGGRVQKLVFVHDPASRVLHVARSERAKRTNGGKQMHDKHAEQCESGAVMQMCAVSEEQRNERSREAIR